jgi:hypothetical protein
MSLLFGLNGGVSYRRQVLGSVPVCYWRLGESSGTTATDLMGYQNGTYSPNSAGSWTGGTLAQTGALAGSTDTAASFNGSTGFVDITNQTNLQITGNITIELWCKLTDNGQYSPLVTKAGSTEYEVSAELRTGSAKNALAWRSTNALGTTTNIAGFFTGYTGVWVHVAVTVTGTTVRAYRNAELIGSADCGSRTSTTNNVWIGRRGSNTLAASGLIDEVAIYNRALSIGEIGAHYQAAGTI